MIFKINKLKILKKFHINSIYEFTTKIYVPIKKNYNKIKEYKLPINLKILKILYNIKNKKFKQYFNKFLFSNLYNFFNILKLRLDFILFNLNLFLTLNQAKQNISHKHVLINNKIARTSSYCIKDNDIIHLYNVSYNLIKNICIYNYIMKIINIYTITKTIHKNISSSNDFKTIILKLHEKNLYNMTCNKQFKIYIMSTNTSNTASHKYLNTALK